jgi:two-component system chemotaxis response regulator CheY
LMDLNMPGMNGTELIHKMKEEDFFSHTPVIIISSERHQGRIEQLYEQGVRAFITKPLTPEVLRDKVIEVLGVDHV